MITQGVKVTARCGACGGVQTRDTGQYIDGGRLWWGTETRCDTCAGGHCERDTGGPTPAGVRDALLAKHGPARLRLADGGADPVPAVRALREVLHLSLPEARAAAGTLRETGMVGTLVEMEFIAAALRRRSVATTIETQAR